ALTRTRDGHALELDAIQLYVGEETRLVLVKMQERSGFPIKNSGLSLNQRTKTTNADEQRLELLERCRCCMLHAVNLIQTHVHPHRHEKDAGGGSGSGNCACRPRKTCHAPTKNRPPRRHSRTAMTSDIGWRGSSC